MIFRETKQGKGGVSVFVYSEAGLNAVGKKPIIVSVVVALVSLVFYYG